LVAAGVSLQDSESIKENVQTPFTELMGKSSSPILTAISVTLDTRISQKLPDAIDLVIDIKNDNPDELELWNPRELLELTITGKDGVRLSLPHFPPRWIVDTVYPDKIPKNFSVLRVLTGGRDVTLADATIDRIHISSKEHYRISVRMNRILKDPRSPVSLEGRSIPPGLYDVKAALSLWIGPVGSIQQRYLGTSPITIAVAE
jgi:hypothetical protein